MNIMMLTESFPPNCGGSGWSTYYLSKALQKRGHTIIICKIQNEVADITEYDGLKVIPIYNKNLIKKIIKEYNIQLIHCQHRKSTILGVGNGVPCVSTIRDYWHSSYDGTNFDKKTMQNYDKETFNTIFHSYTKLWQKCLSPFLDWYLYHRTKYSARQLAKCNALICVSKFCKDSVQKVIPEMPCEVIHNLLDTKKLNSVQPVTFGGKNVLFVGKIDKYKGAEVVLECARLMQYDINPCNYSMHNYDATKRDITFRFIGQPSKLCKEIANQPNCVVLDYVSNDDVLRYIKGCDILVIPSLWNEPLGRVLLEGMGLGAKIITTNTGGTSDVAIDGFNCLYFDGTAKDLARKIDMLFNFNNRDTILDCVEFGKVMSKNALDTAQSLSEDALVPKFEKFYQDVINGVYTEIKQRFKDTEIDWVKVK